ncbi:MAG: acyl-CoA desaturase [Cryomorphaceae bacterium]|jgi:linoleoyl-CoA desaturase|nr:acyl-CoA desaturase [Cryomorphaceae bacterium]
MEKIYFTPENTNFLNELRERIDNYFMSKNISHFANTAMKIKLVVMSLIYILAYVAIFLVEGNQVLIYCLYAFIGAWSVFLGLNIGHDAAHNAIFKRPSANQALLLVFDLLGTNSYNWVNRHIGAHHVYPNIMDYDSDIQQTSVVKIFPKDMHHVYHRLQHIYMPLVYMLYIFRWVLYRDFKDAFSKRIGVFNNSNYPKKELVKMIFFKLFYLSQFIAIPALVLKVSWLFAISAFFLLTVVGSLVITFVLLSTHVGEDAQFPEPNADHVLPHSWSYHQVLTASDFGKSNPLIVILFGGFNFHVIHHLCPHICHIHYPAITKILEETCQKYNYPYRSERYLISAVISHFRLLRNNSKNAYSAK